MIDQGAYGSRIGAVFKVQNPPTLVTQVIQRGTLAVTRLEHNPSSGLLTPPIPVENAFLIPVMTRACIVQEMWVDGKSIHVEPRKAGDAIIYDLRSNPIAFMRSPVACMMFYLSRSALDVIAQDSDADTIKTLDVRPGKAFSDPVFSQLASMLRGVIDRPEELNGLFVDHILHAFGTHAAQAYGGMRAFVRPPRGGLAPWQERRARELMDAGVESDVTLLQLASECRLSVSHFAKAFRQSTGKAPHRWLMERRVDRAKDLLSNPEIPLIDVSLGCGFASQSHFTRIFTMFVGVSPGKWRRMRAR
jgi:AraC family transcriptional regulator